MKTLLHVAFKQTKKKENKTHIRSRQRLWVKSQHTFCHHQTGNCWCRWCWRGIYSAVFISTSLIVIDPLVLTCSTQHFHQTEQSQTEFLSLSEVRRHFNSVYSRLNLTCRQRDKNCSCSECLTCLRRLTVFSLSCTRLHGD